MKSIFRRRHKYAINMITLLFVSTMLTAQNDKKELYTSDLDSLWSYNTYINKMTNDGKWVVLMEAFHHKENVLMLKHTSDTITFTLPVSQWVSFSDNNRWFGCITANKELHVIDLVKLTKETYRNIQSYSFSESGNYLAAYQKDNEGEKLLVINLNKKSTELIPNVNKYVWHPQQNSLLVTTMDGNKNHIGFYQVEAANYKVIKEHKDNSFNDLFWNNSGNAIMFSEQGNNENYLNYHPINGSIITLGDATIQKKFPHYTLASSSPHMSDDGQKILFYRQLKKESLEADSETMEVWNTTDPWIYPKMKDYKERKLQSLLTAWYPDTNQLIAIETEDKPTSALDVNHDFAIVFNELIYEPQYKEFPNTDIYAKNLKTGEEHLVVKNQYIGPGFTLISPSGKYMSYFKDSNWWVYDYINKQSINLTKDLKNSFENFEVNRAGDVPPCGNPGWLTDDTNIILYDQYDIWVMSPDGRHKERITKGREEKIKYRVNKDYRRNNYLFLTININFSSSPFNPDKGIVLEMFDSKHLKSGYALWGKNHSIRKLVFNDRRLDYILTSDNFNNVVFRQQKFNEPQGIYNFDLKQNKEKLLYQGNKALFKYDLGSTKLIHYKIDEVELTAGLIYPANFNPEKKYPMIVNIYEKQSKKLHVFNPPSHYEYTGFNVLKYTTNGYFVLLPDIAYTLQDPGISALNCVTSAVNKVLELGVIDKNKIGLIGHSFGGYESAFIATQTDIFAAVVAGAAATNFTSHYHSVGWTWKQPEIWRYESQQWRMGDSFYNIRAAYIRNSPLHHVENVNTPLLLWSGKEDYQVHWTQSIEMFLALKRLNKKGKLLLFDNEPHTIMDNENQKKLSSEIMTWFQLYCK